MRRALELGQTMDARWPMLVRTVQSIEAHPLGVWPEEFEALGLYCDTKALCTYPHNFLLEVSFHFGWSTLVVFACGFLLIAAIMTRSLVLDGSVTVEACAVSVLVYMLAMQVTGSITDFVSPYLLLLISQTELLRAHPTPKG
jgi:hypothetical protein